MQKLRVKNEVAVFHNRCYLSGAIRKTNIKLLTALFFFFERGQKFKIMKIGEIKNVENRGLKFDLQATDEEFLVYDDKNKKHTIRQLGIVVTDVPKNKYGIKKGTKMLISPDKKEEND